MNHDQAHIPPVIEGTVDASVKPDLRQCPGNYCFEWGAPGTQFISSKEPIVYDSLDAALSDIHQRGTTVRGKGRCICNIGPCRRWTGLPEHEDCHEPCEPHLRRDGLPDLFFHDPENLTKEGKLEYQKMAAKLWGESSSS